MGLKVRLSGGRADIAAIEKALPGSAPSRGTLSRSVETTEIDEAIAFVRTLSDAVRSAAQREKQTPKVPKGL